MRKLREFCGFCGSPFLLGTGSPRKCGEPVCGELTFYNPTPVAVLLVQVPDTVVPPMQTNWGPGGRLLTGPKRPGLVVVKRKNEPAAGRLALPGGFMELGETWQQACTRELWEETSIEVLASEVELFDVHSVEGGERVIIFGVTKALVAVDLSVVNERVKDKPYCEEVEEVATIHAGNWTLAAMPFSTHVKAAQKFFDRHVPAGR